MVYPEQGWGAYMVLRRLAAARLFWVLLCFLCGVSAQEKPSVWQDPVKLDRTAILSKHYLLKGLRVLKDTLTSGTLTYDKYIATTDIIIPADQKITLSEGATVFFEPKTSLIVRGSLTAKGTKEKPILFKPVNRADMYIEPESEDTAWTGIIAGAESKLVLENCVVSGSRKNIQSQAPCDSLSIQNILVENSSSEILIADKRIDLTPDSAFTLDCRDLGITDAKSQKRNFNRTPIIAGIACAVLFGGLAVYEGLSSNVYADKATKSTSYDEEHSYEKKRNDAISMAKIFGGCSAISIAAGITLAFALPSKGKK